MSQIKIMDEAVYVSLHANALRKGRSPTLRLLFLLLLAMSK